MRPEEAQIVQLPTDYTVFLHSSEHSETMRAVLAAQGFLTIGTCPDNGILIHSQTRQMPDIVEYRHLIKRIVAS